MIYTKATNKAPANANAPYETSRGGAAAPVNSAGALAVMAGSVTVPGG